MCDFVHTNNSNNNNYHNNSTIATTTTTTTTTTTITSMMMMMMTKKLHLFKLNSQGETEHACNVHKQNLVPCKVGLMF